MDPAQRHRTLALLGIVDGSEARKVPRDGDGDGFYDPDGKGPLPDRTPVVPRVPAARPTFADHVKDWHADLTGLEDLADAASTGAKGVSSLQRGSDTKVGLVHFGDGSEGVVTRYLGTHDRDPESQADADQLASALARAVGIPAPRVLRVDDERTASDPIDGAPWDEGLNSEAALRLGALDLLLGVDSRDPETVVIGADGVVPVQSDQAFADVPLPTPAAPKDKRTARLERIAAMIDDAGPSGLSRTDITARIGNSVPTALRDELLAELVDTGAYILVSSSTGNTGHGAKYVRVQAELPPFGQRAGMFPPPLTGDVLSFWRAFVNEDGWSYNPLTEADVEWLRSALDEVRPQFEHLGRGHWWQFASDRLDRLTFYADGGRDLFAQ